jgi:hypothetical protein
MPLYLVSPRARFVCSHAILFSYHLDCHVWLESSLKFSKCARAALIMIHFGVYSLFRPLPSVSVSFFLSLPFGGCFCPSLSPVSVLCFPFLAPVLDSPRCLFPSLFPSPSLGVCLLFFFNWRLNTTSAPNDLDQNFAKCVRRRLYSVPRCNSMCILHIQ